MKTQFMKFTLAAGFALALAFTVSCSSDGDGGEQPSSSSGTEISSSSGGGSSSSNGTGNSSSSNGESSSSVINSSSSNNTGDSSSSNGESSSSVINSSSSNNTGDSSSSNGESSSSVINSSSSNNTGDSSSSNGSSSSSIEVVYGSPVTYEGKTYKTVLIGTQRWMAENLNYAVDGSKCYNNQESNCNKYGRLYDWSTAMALPSYCNNSASCTSQINSPHRGICPSGWHIPSNEDWDKLMRYVDGTSGTDSPYDSDTAGKYLKAASGWSGNGNGEDSHGFSALPGGVGSGDYFSDAGNYGSWWSTSENGSKNAYRRRMNYDGESARRLSSDKSYLISVRCVQD